VETAIELLRTFAATVGEVTLPSTTIPLDEIYTKVRSVEGYTYHSQWIAESTEKYQAATRERILRNSAEVNAPAHAQVRRELDLLRIEIKNVFATVDLLVTPTLPTPPGTIAQAAEPSIRNTSPFDGSEFANRRRPFLNCSEEGLLVIWGPEPMFQDS
jgi:Asp-tRNA(Asn)/Glu-tRNA(Gln) amidotransferase A subunit family amidase